MRSLTSIIAAILVGGVLAVSASAAIVEVEVVDNDFVPGEVTINVGDTVRWVWDSFMPHNVESAPWEAVEFDSGYFSGDTATFEYTFTDPGVVDYYCDLHGFPVGNSIAGMAGQVTVLVPEPTGVMVVLVPAIALLARRTRRITRIE